MATNLDDSAKDIIQISGSIEDMCYMSTYTGSQIYTALNADFDLGLDRKYYQPKELNNMSSTVENGIFIHRKEDVKQKLTLFLIFYSAHVFDSCYDIKYYI